MAHISYTYYPIKKNGDKTLVYSPACEGVSLSEKDVSIPKEKCSQIYNFDILPDRITTRSPQNRSLPLFNPEGEVYGINKELFCGKTIMHIGKCLYCYDNDETEPAVLFTDMPEKNSLFCEFMSKMYIYCAGHVYSVNNLFEFVEEEPFAPVFYEGVSPTLVSAKPLSIPCNMLAPRVTVSYRSNELNRFSLPEKADVSRGVVIYENDERVDSAICTIEEKVAKINRSGIPDSRVVKVQYYLKDASEIGYDDFIGGCSVATAFGGETNGGTRIFFTGNGEKNGRYYKSELQDPLFVSSDEFETIGNGSENITCLKKMYGDLLLFTSKSIFRMGYKLTDDGPLFVVKELSSGIGCDCPDSVQLIDNRVVFLNSQKGVFIVDSTENTGEQNVKPLGKNILKGGGAGLLDNSKESLANASSLDYDRKYMLFVGGKAYIWDYDRSGFLDYGNYAMAQERLIWYIYDGIEGEIFFETENGVKSVTKKNVSFFGFDKDGTKNTVCCRYVSGDIDDLGSAIRKIVTEMDILLCGETDSNYSLSAYADGEKYYEVKLPSPRGKKEKLKITLPHRALYGFGFEICGNGGIEIKQILLKFRAIKD